MRVRVRVRMHTVHPPVATVDGPWRAVGEVEVEAMLRRDLVAARYHHWIGRRGVAATSGGGRVSAEAHALCLGLQLVRRPVACRAPVAESACLVQVDLGRPGPRHGQHLEGGAQPVVVLARRAHAGPEGRPLYVAEHAPSPALGGPVLLVMVAAVLDKLEELAVGDLVRVRARARARARVRVRFRVRVVPCNARR